MDDSIEELTRKRVAYHPPPQRTDMSRRLDLTVETGTIQPPQTAAESLILQQHRWKTMKRKDAWSEHHSVWNIDRGRCNSENCPGRKRTTTKEAYMDPMIPDINVWNAVLNLEGIHTLVLILVTVLLEIAMINLYHNKYHGKEVEAPQLLREAYYRVQHHLLPSHYLSVRVQTHILQEYCEETYRITRSV